MHAVSSGGSNAKRNFGKVQGGKPLSGKPGTVYKIGNRKFTLDGKDGKTLDDIIEVGEEKRQS